MKFGDRSAISGYLWFYANFQVELEFLRSEMTAELHKVASHAAAAARVPFPLGSTRSAPRKQTSRRPSPERGEGEGSVSVSAAAAAELADNKSAGAVSVRLELAEDALAEKNTEAVLLLSRVALLEAELSSALAEAAVQQRWVNDPVLPACFNNSEIP
jgi:hypothetical protein